MERINEKKKGRVEKAKEFKETDIRLHDEKRLERTITTPLPLFLPERYLLTFL